MAFSTISGIRYRCPSGQGQSPRPSKGEPSKFDIDEEYKSTLRSKSYVDMLRELHKQPKTDTPTTSFEEGEEDDDGDDDEVDDEKEEQEQEEASFLPHVSLTGHFLLPEHEYLLTAGEQAPLHGLLRDYLESSTKACNHCHSLLKSIDGARAYLRVVRRVIALHKRSSEHRPCTLSDDLARVAQLANPLSNSALVDFPTAHGGVYAPVIPRLRSLQRRVARRAGLVGFGWKASGLALVPCRERRRGGQLSRLSRRLDAAARGAYALDREFDTVGRMLARSSDEIEHGRGAVREFLRNSGGYPWGEVVRRFEAAEGWLLELEEHVHLCLLTIDRARKLLVQE